MTYLPAGRRPVRALTAALLALATAATAAPAQSSPPQSTDLLVVLTDTETERDGLPVFAPHPDARRYHAVLERGFSGRLLRLYRAVQVRRAARGSTRASGTTATAAIEPAYLVLTRHQGGFPRVGFHLGELDKRGVAYVDLHRDQSLSGSFGATDQIFPHELMHHILRQLAGEVPEGGANQVHAIGVRTDPYVAFDEGFAEHAQVLAVDDSEATADTRALATDHRIAAGAERNLAAYRRALIAGWSGATRARLGFVLWFSRTEQALRYHAVRANRFAFEPTLPERVLTRSRLADAYLLANVLPGDSSGPRRSPGRLTATEGAVSTFFHRWVTAPAIQTRYREPAFYQAYALAPTEVPPLENAYLKLFFVFERDHPHDLVAVARAYVSAFPDETDAILGLAREVGFDPTAPRPPEIWLANSAFTTGTTLFDQFRGVPRRHTFDLNAASLVDLLGIEGMSRTAADAILRGAPYDSLGDLRRIPAVTPELAARLVGLESAMQRLRAAAVEDSATLSLWAILRPSVSRAVLWLAVASLAAAGLYTLVRRVRWWRALLNGAGISLLGLGAAWLSDAAGGTVAWWLPVLAFGVPAALWQLARRRTPAGAARAIAAWALAALTPFLITRPWL